MSIKRRKLLPGEKTQTSDSDKQVLQTNNKKRKAQDEEISYPIDETAEEKLERKRLKKLRRAASREAPRVCPRLFFWPA